MTQYSWWWYTIPIKWLQWPVSTLGLPLAEVPGDMKQEVWQEGNSLSQIQEAPRKSGGGLIGRAPGGGLIGDLWWRKGGERKMPSCCTILVHAVSSVALLYCVMFCHQTRREKCMIQPTLVYSVAGLRSNGPVIDQLPIIRQHERGGGYYHQQYFCKGWCKLKCMKHTYLYLYTYEVWYMKWMSVYLFIYEVWVWQGVMYVSIQLQVWIWGWTVWCMGVSTQCTYYTVQSNGYSTVPIHSVGYV